MKQQFLDLNGLTELVTYLKKSITEQKEILPYASNKLFPSTGNVNTIYIDTATNSIYRWDSSNKKYEILAKAVKSVSISESTENGKITLTVDGNKTTVPIHGLGSAAYTNSSAYSPAGHTHTKAQVGLGNVDNTADSAKSVKYATSAGSASSSTTSGSLSSAGTLDTVDKLNAFIEGGKVKYALMSAIDGLDGMIKNDGICISTPWSSTGYGHQFYINDNGYDLYHRFRNTTKVNNVDTTTWSSWKQILDSSNYNSYAPTKTGGGASGTWGINVSGNAAYPQGFQSRVTSATWGNQTGTLITDWHTSNGGDIQFRDNSGQLNVITDGFFYQNEGRNLVLDSVNYSNYAATKSHTHSNYMGAVSANGYYGMAKPDGSASDWIRTTSPGIIPYQAGGRGSGHSALGTDSWYFSSSYIDHMYSTDVKIADKVLLQYDSTNACLNFVFS